MKTITVGDSVVTIYQLKDGSEFVTYLGGMMVDNDGSGGNPDNDPFHQDDTTLHRDGVALNPYLESFIVVPPQVCEQTKGIVLGSFCLVHNVLLEEYAFGVVGDIGPRDRLGEASVYCAKQLGVDPSPVSGGTLERIIEYSVFVGVPALIGKYRYVLQPYL